MKGAAVWLMVLAMAAPAAAQDFSKGSEAKSWNLFGEEKAAFSGKVVDILCELTGDCPDNCGDGTRQLGIVRDADGALILPLKNRQAAFTGAATDMQPFCGKTVDVDGLMVGDKEYTPTKHYMVQLIRVQGDDEWTKTNLWTKDWAARNPELKGQKGPWFRRDPRVNAAIEKDGYLGLGAEQDQAFIDYYFE